MKTLAIALLSAVSFVAVGGDHHTAPHAAELVLHVEFKDE